MTDNDVMHLAVQAMVLGTKVAGPILLVSLVIGFAISLIQSVTQVQEMTLTFVPKVIAIAIVLLVAGNWMMGEMVGFTRQLFADLPALLKT
ncbi:Flagellar biosynthetic protein FliQ [Austwickia sp. TVS 96-490-7B]|uniref:flagellar biosynthesis protein FliQ n=1 Tax=Austwickia sp. TVS 96-490-7B TaxID=2830843 RepID=UPI001C576849|nr:flagellar biosynthesis protein FliQ [Austwickia sp. TVS 96-490-7B]MBW3083913.1 Flagellar biosynthetic protein FliQ [Austwickia sp. TVS 96-490-7B]